MSNRTNVDKVWKIVFGNDGQGFAYWAGAIRTFEGEPIELWKDTSKPVMEWEPNPQDFRIYDSEDDVWYKVTTDQLVDAHDELVASKWTHCGGFAIGKDDDACVEDVIMQTATFGELVYG